MEMSWISVGDRLPAYGQPVIVCSGSGVVQKQTFYRDGGDDEPDWWQNVAENADPHEIEGGDHWMPLPPPAPSAG